MDSLILRQGTCYRHKASHRMLWVIHHNPMELQSLALADDAAAPGVPQEKSIGILTADELIAMRKSGEFEELYDLDAAQLKMLLEQICASGRLDEKSLLLVQKMLETESA